MTETTAITRTRTPRRLVRAGIYAAVLATALGVVWVATRGRPAAAAMPAGHVHAAASGGGVAVRTVSLSSSEARRIGVTYATAEMGPLVKQVRTVGQVTLDETRVRTISPRIDGGVDRLYVDETGQFVERGQPLLAIYSPMLVSAQEELLLARRLTGEVAAASADARGNAAELLASARRRLAYWDVPDDEVAEIERSGVVRKTLTLRSPARGYVLEKNVLAGQRIMAGDALYRVADLSDVWVEGEVFEQDIADVRVGQRVTARFDALPGVNRAGRISYVYPTLDPQTRTVRVRVVLSNPDLRLKPGMYATLLVDGTARANVLTVPRTAVLSTGERNIVFVRHADGTLMAHEVVAGERSDDRVEILRGIAAGETVVTSATFLVDAESDLGAALGGMGSMPGMDMTSPPKTLGIRQSGEAAR